ncbi:serine hydrolase [Crossiella sp. SN42]|uniref:serine hydrolase n=1 Tax=Crossiella sp. SN42 TaxID=2944808 RepID=UPI00207C2577|nr:serine hydrolase [Crossiella sp. SN42]MCO1580023.1 serine hydrolase [Crossiella sp. SN42]
MKNSVGAMASVFVVCAAGLLSIHLLGEAGPSGPPETPNQANMTTVALPPSDAPGPEPTEVVQPGPTTRPKQEKGSPTELGNAVNRAVRAGGSATGVGLLVLEVDGWRELASVDPDRQFRSASLVKLLIAVDALQSGASTATDLRTMLSASHDGIASELWVRLGGNTMVQRQARRMGLSRTLPPLDPMHWGDTKVSARDVAKMYRHILTELPKAHRELIMSALAAAPKIAADRFDQHFGIPNGLPKVQWAVKQGWATGRAGTDLHTSGVLAEGTRVVVLLSTHSPGTSYARAAKSLNTGAGALAGLF